MTERPTYYTRAGDPLSFAEFVATIVKDRQKRVARTTVGDTYVSTVFLGLDHACEGPPMIFETMIFGGDRDQDCWRYSTEEEARAGHAKAVELLKRDKAVSDIPMIVLHVFIVVMLAYILLRWLA